MSNVLYSGQSLHLTALDAGVAELSFKRLDGAINKLDRGTLQELEAVTALLENSTDVTGLLVSSDQAVFVAGADITEFAEVFAWSEQQIIEHNWQANRLFERLAALPMPSVVAINGFALGGGLELALCFDYRVMSSAAKIGLPEVNLGLIPGYGGTVRLPRTASVAVALEWIVSGKPQSAAAALSAGVVDQQVAPEELRAAALFMLGQAQHKELDWAGRRQDRLGGAQVPASAEDFDQARQGLARLSGRHQPARALVIDLLQQVQSAGHLDALKREGEVFAQLARSQAASSLVQTFLSEQAIKKIGKARRAGGGKVEQAVVLGAGIMGGGIAYTAALHGVAVRMKDIRQEALDLGLKEADKQLRRQVSSGRLSEDRAAQVSSLITAQLDESGFTEASAVIEAVVENIEIKHAVLSQLENAISAEAIVLSNTSSLRIDDLAVPLARPENFAGMHFFNPVPVMPLVEVIRGTRTSDSTVATAVSLALDMGKTPIVVKDCPGFLVNRILAAYIRAFLQLVEEGADFEQIDRVAEAFGWPMGPAYLEDVVGLDTGAHVCDVIFAGYPERMTPVAGNAIKVMLAAGRLGQKNGQGFYRYEAGEGGRPRKFTDPQSHALLAAVQPRDKRDFTDEEIIERLMLPLLVESILALEEGVVDSAVELDTALLLGLGFPAYLGGALVYADWLGAEHLLARCAHYAELGPAYQAPALLQQMAAQRRRFYDA